MRQKAQNTGGMSVHRPVLFVEDSRRQIVRYAIIEADFLGQPSLQRTEADVVLPIAVRDELDPVLSHASGAVVEKEGAGTAAAIEAQLLVQDSGFGCRRAEHHHAAGGSGHQHSEGDEKPRANTRITAPNHVSLLGCCWLFLAVVKWQKSERSYGQHARARAHGSVYTPHRSVLAPLESGKDIFARKTSRILQRVFDDRTLATRRYRGGLVESARIKLKSCMQVL